MTPTEPAWIGSTQQLIDGWRVVLHWQEIDGKVEPAGVEVRRYDVQEDAPADHDRPNDATPEATHFEGFTYDQDRPPAPLTPTLMAKSIGWGDVFGVQRARLVASLEEYAGHIGATSDDRVWAFELGEKAGRGMVLLDDSETPVRAGTGTRADPANDATYRLVARLWADILDDDQLRKTTTASLMRLLRDEHGFPLDPDKESHRIKVQGWLRLAKALHPQAFALTRPAGVTHPQPGRDGRRP